MQEQQSKTEAQNPVADNETALLLARVLVYLSTYCTRPKFATFFEV